MNYLRDMAAGAAFGVSGTAFAVFIGTIWLSDWLRANPGPFPSSQGREIQWALGAMVVFAFSCALPLFVYALRETKPDPVAEDYADGVDP